MANELLEFRELGNVSIVNVDIPTLPENRRCTDVIGMVLCLLVFVIPFFVLLGLAYGKQDSRHVAYSFYDSYDNCCNRCGHKNVKIPDLWCSGRDYSNKKYGYDGKCVEDCPEGTIKDPDFKYCMKKDSVEDLVQESANKAVSIEWWKFLIIAILALIFGLALLFGLKYFTAFTIWASLILAFVLCLVMAVLFGVQYTDTSNKEPMFYAIAFGIGAVIIIIIVLFSCKHIPLIIELFKESLKAIWVMPGLFLVPILSNLLFWGLVAVFVYVSLGLFSLSEVDFKKEPGGNVTKENDYYCTFEMPAVAIAAVVMNFIVFIWGLMLWSELMYMVISGSIAAWFFTRYKEDLEAPICTSFYITFKYHVGTVALGSFLMMLLYVLQTIVETMTDNVEYLRYIVECCCQCIIDILDYIKTRAYIETAIHGEPFCKSAKRAMKLIYDNLGPAIKVLLVKSTVLSVMVVLVIMIGLGIGVAMFSGSGNLFVYLFITLMISIIINVFFSVIDVAVDVLFICYCEDVVINNGTTRPYYMSKDLMRFMDTTKKSFDESSDRERRRDSF